MRMLALFVSLLAFASPCMAMALSAEPFPATDNRIKLLAYDEGDVYTITTRYGYQTNIVFAANETVETISVGDRSVWQIIPSGNRMFIRPLVSGATTNMTVLTSKRAYQFDLKSAAQDEKNPDTIYVAKFIYDGLPPPRVVAAAPVAAVPVPPVAAAPVPPVTAPATAPAPAPAPTFSLPVSPSGPNYNYTYSGPDTLAPLQVFDNGEATFIKYSALPQPAPEIYMVDAGGKTQPVPHAIQDSMLVVDTIAGTLKLEQGGETITIYNEQLNPDIKR